MPINYSTIKSWPFEEISQPYGWKDSALYSLSLGICEDPLDVNELRYVYEQDMRSFPTMAAVLAHPGFWVRDPGTGIDWKNAVHVEQRLKIFHPIPATGSVTAKTRVSALIDKGKGKGALMISERQLRDSSSGQNYADVIQISLLRGDGGFTESGATSDAPLAPLPSSPDRQPDIVYTQTTSTQAALMYRLNGDFNPLHADPEVARAAGFERPILHGMCTYGIAARAITQAHLGGDASKIVEFNARFSAPVFPGESIRTEMWLNGSELQFRCIAVERDVIALNNGIARIDRS